MKISICSFSFMPLFSKGEIDIFGYLDCVTDRYGLDTADIWNRMLKSTDEGYVRGVRQAMDEKGLGLANLCVDEAHIWEEDSGERVQLAENAMAHLRAAVILGAKTVRIDMGGPKETMTDEQFDLTVATYKKYAGFAADNGFMVGPENHHVASKVAANMVRVSEAVDHPSYGILLHMGRWAGDGDEGDRACASWVMHTHIPPNLQPDAIEGKMRMLLDAGYEGCWGIEMPPEPDVYDNVKAHLGTVRKAASRVD